MHKYVEIIQRILKQHTKMKTEHKIFCHAVKAELRGKLMAVNAYIELLLFIDSRSPVNGLIFNLIKTRERREN